MLWTDSSLAQALDFSRGLGPHAGNFSFQAEDREIIRANKLSRKEMFGGFGAESRAFATWTAA